MNQTNNVLSYQSSVASSMTNNTLHMSLRDQASETPCELYGYIYEIPKDSGVTNDDMVQIFKDHHFDCQVQVKRDDKRPSYSARVKFTNSVHMRVATEKMRTFKLTRANGQDRECRFLPFDPSLSKHHQPSASAASVNPELG